MTTERDGLPNDSSVETITMDIDPAVNDVSSFAAPEVEQGEEQVPSPEVGAPSGVDIQESESLTDTQSDSSVFSSPEFKKYQSSTDKRMAELEQQLSQEKSERQRYAEEESLKTLDSDVNQYEETVRSEMLQQGIDDLTAQQIAGRQASFAKEAFLKDLEVKRMKKEQARSSSELNNRTQLARAYELASQYNIPFTELQEISNPTEMERHAKSLKRIKDLEGRLQGITPSQTYGSSTPASDVAPTNATTVLDRYNAGDPAVSTDMARAAARQMGLTIFD